ncbi:beta-lactamase family protein [Nocardioides panacis]|uniref:Beta-lactamase family protein n=1 Tax=Nocardioides panacis TaxID=2849501 RepID=A0A975T1Z3_9ACTN|nr:serine hydrolase domain-containing protein [Nocardioides panacis]QWZ10021.1 beta-lactamase family protein [Nocardioides panacis]
MPNATEPGVAEGFGAVADAFHQNFTDPGDDAAAVTVLHRGRTVADLWAGTDVVHQRPMPADGLMMVASCSKGITATVLAVLVERGVLDPEEPVAACWPEFAAGGKDRVTLAMVASHTAGLPYPPLGTGLSGLDLHRGDAVTRALAGATPLWEPGTAMAYHPVTYGTLLDEIVRRATGSSIAHHVRTLIADPLGVDMWMGLPEALTSRVVPGCWEPVAPSSLDDDDVPPPGSYAALRPAFLAENPPMDPDYSDPVQVRTHYAAERPAVGAITDARSLATMYAALLGPVEGVRLVEDRTRRSMTVPRTDDVETLVESGTAGPDIRFGVGYQLASPSMPGFGPESFGHTGAGGRLGIADPEHEIGFGYVTSRMRDIGPHGDPRWQALVDAVRRCI